LAIDVTVFVIRTYAVKPEKLAEHNAWGKKLITLMKKKPGLFGGVRGMQVLSHKYGGQVGGFTAMWKFNSLEDAEKWENGFTVVKEEMALRKEFLDLIVPGSYRQEIWVPVRTIKRRKRKTK
jgi:antibiotic biosynthesis monooxygenase (ABM) superfamily enzyme